MEESKIIKKNLIYTKFTLYLPQFSIIPTNYYLFFMKKNTFVSFFVLAFLFVSSNVFAQKKPTKPTVKPVVKPVAIVEKVSDVSSYLANFPEITTPLNADAAFFKRDKFSKLKMVSVADRNFYLVKPADRPVSFGYQGDVYYVGKVSLSADVVVCYYFLDNFKEGMKGKGDMNFILFAASHRKSAKGNPIYITLDGIDDVACVKNNGTYDASFKMVTDIKQYTIIQPTGEMSYEGVQISIDKKTKSSDKTLVKGSNAFNKTGTTMVNTPK